MRTSRSVDANRSASSSRSSRAAKAAMLSGVESCPRSRYACYAALAGNSCSDFERKARTIFVSTSPGLIPVIAMPLSAHSVCSARRSVSEADCTTEQAAAPPRGHAPESNPMNNRRPSYKRGAGLHDKVHRAVTFVPNERYYVRRCLRCSAQ